MGNHRLYDNSFAKLLDSSRDFLVTFQKGIKLLKNLPVVFGNRLECNTVGIGLCTVNKIVGQRSNVGNRPLVCCAHDFGIRYNNRCKKLGVQASNTHSDRNLFSIKSSQIHCVCVCVCRYVYRRTCR